MAGSIGNRARNPFLFFANGNMTAPPMARGWIVHRL
jgi:hypothetical protein